MNNTIAFRNDTVISRLRPGDIIPIMISVDFFDDTLNLTSSDTLATEFRVNSSEIVILLNFSHSANTSIPRDVLINEDIVFNAS